MEPVTSSKPRYVGSVEDVIFVASNSTGTAWVCETATVSVSKLSNIFGTLDSLPEASIDNDDANLTHAITVLWDTSGVLPTDAGYYRFAFTLTDSGGAIDIQTLTLELLPV